MIEVALFGAGRIGKIHAGNLAAQPGVKLKYVVDVSAPAAAELAQRYGGQSRGRGRGVQGLRRLGRRHRLQHRHACRSDHARCRCGQGDLLRETRGSRRSSVHAPAWMPLPRRGCCA